MRTEKKHRLLVAFMTITFRGRSKTICDLVIDTGATHSIVFLDKVEEIGVAWKLVREGDTWPLLLAP